MRFRESEELELYHGCGAFGNGNTRWEKSSKALGSVAARVFEKQEGLLAEFISIDWVVVLWL